MPAQNATRIREKLHSCPPRPSPGVPSPPVPRGLFWPGNFTYRSRWITFQTFVPFHSIADAGRMQFASGQRDQRDQPTWRARWYGPRPDAAGMQSSPRRSRLMRAAFCFCRSPDAHLTQRSRGHEHTFVNSSWKNPYQPQPESQSQTPLRCLHSPTRTDSRMTQLFFGGRNDY